MKMSTTDRSNDSRFPPVSGASAKRFSLMKTLDGDSVTNLDLRHETHKAIV